MVPCMQYLAFDVRHLVAAFADHNNTPGGTLNYLWQEGHDPSRNMDPAILIVMTFLGDGFMVCNATSPTYFALTLVVI